MAPKKSGKKKASGPAKGNAAGGVRSAAKPTGTKKVPSRSKSIRARPAVSASAAAPRRSKRLAGHPVEEPAAAQPDAPELEDNAPPADVPQVAAPAEGQGEADAQGRPEGAGPPPGQQRPAAGVQASVQERSPARVSPPPPGEPPTQGRASPAEQAPVQTEGQVGVQRPETQEQGSVKEQTAAQQPQILAESTMTVDCDFQANEARLTTRLRVHTDPDPQSRLAYNARFFLTRSVGGQDVETEIGYLHSWRIDEATAARPHAKSSWLADLLEPKLRKIHGNLYESALCLRGLFQKEGTVRDVVGEYQARLQDNSLIFIEMVFIKDDFRGAGLLKHAMGGYEALLGELPEWAAFGGSLILVPGKPAEHAEAWKGTKKEDIEKELIQRYQKRKYVVWARNVEVAVKTYAREAFSVMGKAV